MSESKERLKQILKNRSILKGEFKLASGKVSDYYVDARLTTLDGEGVNLISRIFYDEIIKNREIRFVGGPTMGADPIVGSLISVSFEKGNKLNGFLVRKQEKTHGTSKLIEGNLEKGAGVAVVEDVVTTGGSVLKAIDAVEAEGAVVKKVLVVVKRDSEVEKTFRDRGYDLFSIFDIEDLL